MGRNHVNKVNDNEEGDRGPRLVGSVLEGVQGEIWKERCCGQGVNSKEGCELSTKGLFGTGCPRASVGPANEGPVSRGKQWMFPTFICTNTL